MRLVNIIRGRHIFHSLPNFTKISNSENRERWTNSQINVGISRNTKDYLTYGWNIYVKCCENIKIEAVLTEIEIKQ